MKYTGLAFIRFGILMRRQIRACRWRAVNTGDQHILGDYERAYHYFSRHRDLMEAEEKGSEFCSALLAVGDVLTRLKDYDRAEKALLQAVSLCRSLGFRRLLGVGLINLGAAAVGRIGSNSLVPTSLKGYRRCAPSGHSGRSSTVCRCWVTPGCGRATSVAR